MTIHTQPVSLAAAALASVRAGIYPNMFWFLDLHDKKKKKSESSHPRGRHRGNPSAFFVVVVVISHTNYMWLFIFQ